MKACGDRLPVSPRELFRSTQIFLILSLSACATQVDTSSHDEYLELIAYRSVPGSSDALHDECAGLNADIERINGFTDNMKRSRYSMFYLAMGREKVAALRERAGRIGCTLQR